MSGSALNFSSSHAFRYVLDAVPVACWIHSDGVVRYANPALARLLGSDLSPEGMPGRRVLDFLPAGSRAAFEDRTKALLAGNEVPRGEHELLLAGGGSVAVDVVSAVVSYDGGPVILSFFQDITEQRRAERALRKTEARYRRLIEGSVVGVMEFTATGIQDANDVLLRLIGHRREELPEGQLKWRTISPPEDEQLDREKLDELFATGECKPFEKEFLRPDGSRVPVLMGASLVEREPEWRALALVIDQTDRRKLREIEEQKAKLDSLGLLAGGMAHNINNILTGVIGNASLLLENRLVPPDTRGAMIATEIIHSGERAAALTARLLAYAGQGQFVVGAINLRDVVETQARKMAEELPDNIRLTLEIDGACPVLMADEEQLRNMIIALVDNAIEAIGTREDGAITLGARPENVGENSGLARSGEPLPAGRYCVIEVCDNGAGMDSKTLAHAFDPFFSTKFPGRGLGLAAVAGIVRAAGGAVSVNSTRGAGTVFHVYLPANGE